MLAEIENAVIARLTEKAPKVPYMDSVKAAVERTAKIGYSVAIMEGHAEPIGQHVKQHAAIAMWVIFKNLKSDDDRRKGAFPTLESLAQLLYKQTLGLDIAALGYTGFRDVTTDEERAGGVVIYQIDLGTSYTIKKEEEEVTEELLGISLAYLLNGAEKPAATDEITIEAEGE